MYLTDYLLWHRRGPEGHFWLVDPISGSYFDPAMVDYMAPIGLEHFFDAFALVHKREFREAAAEALDIPLEEIRPNLVVEQSCARRFQPTPICVPYHPPAKRAKKNREPASPAHDVAMASSDAKVEQESSTESDSDSSASNSDFSSDGSSDASDLDKFEEAFAEFGKLTEGVDALDFDRNLAGNTSDDVPGLPLEGGLATLQTLANVQQHSYYLQLPYFYMQKTARENFPDLKIYTYPLCIYLKIYNIKLLTYCAPFCLSIIGAIRTSFLATAPTPILKWPTNPFTNKTS